MNQFKLEKRVQVLARLKIISQKLKSHYDIIDEKCAEWLKKLPDFENVPKVNIQVCSKRNLLESAMQSSSDKFDNFAQANALKLLTWITEGQKSAQVNKTSTRDG